MEYPKPNFRKLIARLLAAELTPTEFKIATCLANFRNSSTGRCNPKQDTIAAKCNVTKRCVRETLQSLRARNIIISIKSKPHSPYHHFFCHDFLLLKHRTNGHYPELTQASTSYKSADPKHKNSTPSEGNQNGTLEGNQNGTL